MADLKKLLFFLIILQEKYIVDFIFGTWSNCDYSLCKFPSVFRVMKIIFFHSKQGKRRWKRIVFRPLFVWAFLLNIWKKNTENQFWRKLLPFYVVDAKIRRFWPKLWLFCFMADLFFFVCSKGKLIRKVAWRLFFFTYFFFALSEKKLFSWPGRQRGIYIKNSHNLTMSQKWNRRYIFPEEWSKKIIVFLDLPWKGYEMYF